MPAIIANVWAVFELILASRTSTIYGRNKVFQEKNDIVFWNCISLEMDVYNPYIVSFFQSPIIW